MRIRVRIPAQTVEVDVDKWALEYGTEGGVSRFVRDRNSGTVREA